MTVGHGAKYVKFTIECFEKTALSGADFTYQVHEITLLYGECDVTQDEHILLADLNVSVINYIHQRLGLFLVALDQLGCQLLNAVSL